MLELAIGFLAFALGVMFGWWVWVGSADAEGGTLETPAVVPAAPVVERVRVVEKPTFVDRVIERVLPAPPPIVVERVVEKVVAMPVPPTGEPWKVEFLSGSGRRVLGRETLTGRRKPTITYVGLDGLKGAFVCTGRRADGTWEYRRVGVER